MEKIKGLARLLALWVWFAGATILTAVVIIHLVNFLFPDYPVLAEWIVTVDWRVVVIVFLAVITGGSGLLMISGQAKIRWLGHENRSVVTTYLITAFWLAYYLVASFSVLNQNKLVSLVGLMIIFLFWMPNWVWFLTQFSWRDLIAWLMGVDFKRNQQVLQGWMAVSARTVAHQAKKASSVNVRDVKDWIINFDFHKTKQDLWRLAGSAWVMFGTVWIIAKRLILAAAVLGVIAGLIFGVKLYFHQKWLNESRLALNPIIFDYQPKIVAGGVKVIIYGDKLGLMQGQEAFLYDETSQRQVRADLWINKKVIFTVPLEWRKGQHILKIQRWIFWPENNQWVTAESRPIVLRVVERSLKKDGGWTSFLDQIPQLNEEVKKLNGF
ncbi:MAG: hypothetical protein GXP43_01975 [bacterium]|nr:hypothetical protein [bacterium]